MTRENAIIVTEGEAGAFVDVFGTGRAVIAASEGCRAVRLTRGVASPSRFTLLAECHPVGA